MGLGRFGGGLGVTRWLAAQGARVTVTDLEPAEKLAKPVGELADLVASGGVRCVLGEHRDADFRDTDLIVANPAVPRPWDNPFLRIAKDAGVPITTEIRLTCERLPRERVIGVTGSAGKSTTSAMIAHILSALAGAGRLGGNIGGSLLAEIDVIGQDEWTVVELSSAQLYWLGAGVGYPDAEAWTPEIAVITSYAPNHVDWHGSLEHYIASKQNLLAGSGIVIYGDSPTGSQFDAGERYLEIVRSDLRPTLRIPGAHNRQNAIVAATAVREAVGAKLDASLAALGSFGGLPHRLQLVAEGKGIRAFDDSKSTTPDSAALAIAAFDEEGEVGAGRVRLICGGYDKKVDLGPMAQGAARCAGVYTIGTTGPSVAKGVAGAGGNAVECGDLDRAVASAFRDAKSGDVVVLSPGCASWDQFENYEVRGDMFAAGARQALGVP